MGLIFRTQTFLQRISESFVHNKWELSPKAILLIHLITLLAIGLILIYIILQRIRIYRQRKKPGPFVKTNKAEIREILLTSMVERSRFELSFSDQPKFAALCTLVDLSGESLTLELPLNITPTSEWIGREIFIYFSTAKERNKRIFYFFKSKIIRYYNQLKGYYVEIEFPSYIEIKQKRRHFRIEAKNDDFDRVIFYVINPEEDIREVKQLPKPIFIYPPPTEKQNKPSPIQIVNISAGGIRLKFSNEIKKALSLNTENLPDILLYLSFQDNGKKKKILLWCRPRNYFEDFVTRDLEVGMEFIKEGFLDPKDKKRILWKRISPEEGQDDLAKWVFLKNLRLIQKGVT